MSRLQIEQQIIAGPDDSTSAPPAKSRRCTDGTLHLNPSSSVSFMCLSAVRCEIAAVKQVLSAHDLSLQDVSHRCSHWQAAGHTRCLGRSCCVVQRTGRGQPHADCIWAARGQVSTPKMSIIPQLVFDMASAVCFTSANILDSMCHMSELVALSGQVSGYSRCHAFVP